MVNPGYQGQGGIMYINNTISTSKRFYNNISARVQVSFNGKNLGINGVHTMTNPLRVSV
jgi:hypothetical protein